jgi:hypothetical protein
MAPLRPQKRKIDQIGQLVGKPRIRLRTWTGRPNLGNFLRTLATPEPIQDWPLSSLKEKRIKIRARSPKFRFHLGNSGLIERQRLCCIAWKLSLRAICRTPYDPLGNDIHRRQ